jgi:hypothetical protein
VSTVEEIESAIEKLPPEKFLALVDRLRARHADAWDRQIERDSASGALDFLLQKADADMSH